MKFEPVEFKTKQGEVIKISLGDISESEECYEFSLNNFFPPTPINVLISVDEEKKRYEFLESLVNCCLESNASLVARNESGKIVAVGLSEISYLNCPSKIPPFDNMLFTICNTVGENVNLFELYDTDKILHFFLTAVSENYGRQGLLQKLLELSMELGKTAGAGVMRVEAMSAYTLRAALKLGFEVIKTIDYVTIKYQENTPLASKSDQLAQHPQVHLVARSLN